jgi:hypothetical protein
MPGSSETAICNIALAARLGQSRIPNLQDTSKEARLCNEFYEHARDFTTQAALWGHARTVATLDENADNDLEDDFAYSYAYPSDCLRIVYLLPETGKAFDRANAVRSKRVGDNIYSDEQNARAYYIRQLTDASKFSPAFVDAISWYLASLLVQPLRLENQLTITMLQGFGTSLARAVALDEAEEIFQQTADEAQAEWHRAR